jgi:hypothetical protein
MMSGNPDKSEADLGHDGAAKGKREGRSFDELAGQEDPGIVREFIQFLKYNKKWWLTPILIVTLLLIGAAILLPSPVAPFIYTLF